MRLNTCLLSLVIFSVACASPQQFTEPVDASTSIDVAPPPPPDAQAFDLPAQPSPDGMALAPDTAGRDMPLSRPDATTSSAPDMRPPDASADPSQLLAASADGTGDGLSATPRPAYLDIKSTAVHLVGRSLRFEIELLQPVPQNPPQTLFYGWFVDTDGSAATGQKYNDIGSDYNVQLDYESPRGWLGLVFPIQGGGAPTPITTFTIAGTKITLSIPLSSLGNPARFRFISIDQLDDNLGYGDIVPDQGSVSVVVP